MKELSIKDKRKLLAELAKRARETSDIEVLREVVATLIEIELKTLFDDENERVI